MPLISVCVCVCVQGSTLLEGLPATDGGRSLYNSQAHQGYCKCSQQGQVFAHLELLLNQNRIERLDSLKLIRLHRIRLITSHQVD